MVADSGRRDVRFKVRLPATLVVGRSQAAMLTEDVSFRGLFLRTDTPPGLRHLVRVEMSLPPEPTPFVAHGMVVHLVHPGERHPSHPPGAGVMFYGIDRAARMQWERFIHYVRLTFPIAVQETVVRAPVNAPDPVRRQHERFAAVLEVRPQSMEELSTMLTRDVSKGGMFISTAHELPLGTEMRTHVVHPVTGLLFELCCVVRRTERGARGAGLGVELVGLDEAERQRFQDFVLAGVPISVEDVMVITERGDRQRDP